MTPAQDLPDFAERRPRSVRPPIRRKRKPSLWQFLRRTIQLWAAFTRLMLFRFADRSLGGDELGRELIRARRLRAMLEGMGGVFIKVGQLLSVRTDLYPWEVCREYANLLDQVVPFSGEVAEQILVEELGVPLHAVFSRFDRQPIAAASIGQVHIAWLRTTGEKVAIKIQRPGIVEESSIDLTLMRMFARFMDSINFSNPTRIAPMIAELRRIMDEELSYINEARAADDFRRTLKGRKHVHAPRVLFNYTTDRVLTMEFVEGIAASALIKAIENEDREALASFEALGIDRKKLAKRFYRAVLEQINEHNISHSDPHPGNLIIMPGNKICFIDFGAVGYFGPSFRARMERITAAVGNLDVDAAVDATLASWEPLPRGDIDRFKSELKPVYQRAITNSASKHGDPRLKTNGSMFIESSQIAAKCGIAAPWEHLRFARLIWEFDTTVVTLHPTFNIAKATRQYYQARAARMFKKNLKAGNIKRFLGGIINVLATAPQDIQEVRYQAFSLMRRSDNLFIHSMSKMSLFGKQVLDMSMTALVSSAAALVYYRVTRGADETDGWLGEHLPVALPWWACLLILLYMTMSAQRMRLRITEIEQ
jgi:ubiquinone biosynthesis protein